MPDHPRGWRTRHACKHVKHGDPKSTYEGGRVLSRPEKLRLDPHPRRYRSRVEQDKGEVRLLPRVEHKRAGPITQAARECDALKWLCPVKLGPNVIDLFPLGVRKSDLQKG